MGGVLLFPDWPVSGIDPEYDPRAFAVGLVMVAYAAVVGARDWLRHRE